MMRTTLQHLNPFTASLALAIGCTALATGCTVEEEPVGPNDPGYEAPSDPAEEERVDLSGFLPLEVGNVWIYDWESTASSYSKYGSSKDVDAGLAVLEITGRSGDAFEATFSRPGLDASHRTYQATPDAIFVDGDAALSLDDPEDVFGFLRTAQMATFRFDGDTLAMSSEEQDGCYGCTIAGVQVWTPEEGTTSSETSRRGVGVTSYRYTWRNESYDFKFNGSGSAELVGYRLHDGTAVVAEDGDVDALLAEARAKLAEEGGEG